MIFVFGYHAGPRKIHSKFFDKVLRLSFRLEVLESFNQII